ncbi:MAG: efflux RND transporter periplasmic adaptor subunit [Planctomycetaceae bacterium]
MSHSAHAAPRWVTWSLAVFMTAVVTGMLLVLAGVFHPKVPNSTAADSSTSADGRSTAVARIIQQPRYETATGSVRPVHESAVASKLLAKVTELDVVAGQAVTENQVLARLDDNELQARVKQGEAAQANAQAQLDKATQDFGRIQQLKQKGVAAQAEFDAASTALKGAQAALEQAKQGVREAQVMLDYATVRSPMSGIIIDKRVEVGDTVAPGQVMLTLFDPTHMQLVASVRESLALKLKTGQKLPTRLDALDLDCEATISELVPEADIATRSFTVKVTGPCPPGAYSGMFGRLLLPQGDEDILVIPEAAVQRVGQLTMVDVVSDGRLSRRNVRIGRSIDSDVEVLAGLSRDEVVALR